MDLESEGGQKFLPRACEASFWGLFPDPFPFCPPPPKADRRSQIKNSFQKKFELPHKNSSNEQANMTPNKIKLLKIILSLGALYYLVGAFVHFFGLTVFPFFDGKLYAPYHDSVIALTSFIFSLLLLVIARNPLKNTDTLKVVIIGALLASIFSIVIIWKVDFQALGAPAKKIQTIAEGIIGFIFTGLLLWLYPQKSDRL